MSGCRLHRPNHGRPCVHVGEGQMATSLQTLETVLQRVARKQCALHLPAVHASHCSHHQEPVITLNLAALMGDLENFEDLEER
jgi:hypothetical protein